jgi:hypothetical protein
MASARARPACSPACGCNRKSNGNHGSAQGVLAMQEAQASSKPEPARPLHVLAKLGQPAALQALDASLEVCKYAQADFEGRSHDAHIATL